MWDGQVESPTGWLTAGVWQWVLGVSTMAFVWQCRCFDNLARVTGDGPSHQWVHIGSSLMVMVVKTIVSRRLADMPQASIGRDSLLSTLPLASLFTTPTVAATFFQSSQRPDNAHLLPTSSPTILVPLSLRLCPIAGEQTTFPE